MSEGSDRERRGETLHLLATRRQVDRALADGRTAHTWRGFVRETASARGRPATPEMTRLAAAMALAGVSEDEVPAGASEGLAANCPDGGRQLVIFLRYALAGHGFGEHP